MKIGYVGELKIKGFSYVFANWINRLVTDSVNDSLDFLVLSGGISTDYHTTLSFVSELGKQLSESGIKLRFIVGNTDFYYPESETTPDKETKFREILYKYRRSEYYLPTHPIFTRNTRVLGAETWYDYSLYRGKPRDLKDITKKRWLFMHHPDNIFITDPSDYTLGVNNLFDTRYCDECMHRLREDIKSQYTRHGGCDNLIVVTYFKGSKALLSDSYKSRYFGAFEGSLKIGEILSSLRVTQNIYGLPFTKETVKINGVSYINSSGKVRVIDYGTN